MNDKADNEEERGEEETFPQLVGKFENYSSQILHKTNSNTGEIPVAIDIPKEQSNSTSILINLLSLPQTEEEGQENVVNKGEKRMAFLRHCKSSALSSFVCLDSQTFLQQVNYEEKLMKKTERYNSEGGGKGGGGAHQRTSLLPSSLSKSKLSSDTSSSSNRDHPDDGDDDYFLNDENDLVDRNVNPSDVIKKQKGIVREEFAKRYTMKTVAELSSSKLSLPSQKSLSDAKELKYAKMRKGITEELIQTERDYVRDLEITIRLFLSPIRRQKLLSGYEIASLFSNLEQLLPINKALLDDLEQTIRITNQSKETAHLYSQWIGEIFSAHVPKMNALYSTYCSNQPNIHSRLTSYQSTYIEFKKHLETCFKHGECRKLQLDSFLILPLQRICKYPLFFKQLVTYTPESLQDGQFDALISGQKCVEQMVNQVNSKVKEVENLAKLVEVLFKIENGPDYFTSIVDETHEFIQEGSFSINSSPSHLFLFSNLMLFCHIKSSPSFDSSLPNEPSSPSPSSSSSSSTSPNNIMHNISNELHAKTQDKLRVYLSLDMKDCSLKNEENLKTNSLTVVHMGKEFEIDFETRSAKVSWSSKIRKFINNCKGESVSAIKRKNPTIISLASPPLPSSSSLSSTSSSSSSSSPSPFSKSTSKGFFDKKKTKKSNGNGKKNTNEDDLKLEIASLKKQLQTANALIDQLKAENEKLKSQAK